VQRPTREELIALAKADPEAIADLVLALWDRIEELEARIAELERNSRTSSKPSSTDKGNFTNPPKPKSRRGKSGRKPGGQKGHRGSTLQKVSHPDHIVRHQFTADSVCQGCGHHLNASSTGEDWEVRQVFDIPPIKLEVTEHRAQRCHCPGCGQRATAPFPEGVTAPTQYGSRLQATAVYLRDFQLLPYQRLSELFGDLFAVSLSEGTLANIMARSSQKAEVALGPIKQALIESPVAHVDETGCTINGKRHWLHVFSTERLTCYHLDPQRGRAAMERLGILPHFRNLLVHDCLAAYFTFTECRHSLCNPHLLRELTYLHEELDQNWAGEMIEVILRAKSLADRELERAEKARRVIGPGRLRQVLTDYHEALDRGYAVNPEPPPNPLGKKGRPARGKVLNLLDRMQKHWEEILGFFFYPGVYPFSNNQAEQDVRMMKVREKVSGGSRSEAYGQGFCQVRSIISSARKQGRNMLATLVALQASPLALGHSLAQET
jgi:transposase